MSRLMSSMRACTRMVQLVLLLCLASPVASGTGPTERSAFHTPICGFEFLTYRSADQQKTFVEVLSQIPTDNFQFVKSRHGFFASFRVTISLFDPAGIQMERESFVDSVHVDTFKEIDVVRTPKLLRFGFLVPPGVYEAKVSVTDLETLSVVSFTKKIPVPDYYENSLKVSDVQIATAIVPTQDRNVLVKNRHKVLPNILRVLNGDADVLYVYTEIYNLAVSQQDSASDFSATFTIRDELGLEVKSVAMTRAKPGSSSFLAASIPVEELPTGKYVLHLEVYDPSTLQKSGRQANFIIIRSDIGLQEYSKLLSHAGRPLPTY